MAEAQGSGTIREGDMMRAKGAFEVKWGLVPGKADEMKQWFYTSADYEHDKSLPESEETRFVKMRKEAFDFMNQHIDPRQYNWAELTWIWF